MKLKLRACYVPAELSVSTCCGNVTPLTEQRKETVTYEKLQGNIPLWWVTKQICL